MDTQGRAAPRETQVSGSSQHHGMAVYSISKFVVRPKQARRPPGASAEFRRSSGRELGRVRFAERLFDRDKEALQKVPQGLKVSYWSSIGESACTPLPKIAPLDWKFSRTFWHRIGRDDFNLMRYAVASRSKMT